MTKKSGVTTNNRSKRQNPVSSDLNPIVPNSQCRRVGNASLVRSSKDGYYVSECKPVSQATRLRDKALGDVTNDSAKYDSDTQMMKSE